MLRLPPARILSLIAALASVTTIVGCFSPVADLVPNEPGQKHGAFTAAAWLAADPTNPRLSGNAANLEESSDNLRILSGVAAGEGAGTGTGMVEIYDPSRSGWESVATIFDSGATGRQGFGQSLNTRGLDVLVGASLADSNAGRAFVFVQTASGLQQQGSLVAADRSANDGFGLSVSIDGDIAIVGAPFHSDTNTGAAYVFTRSGTIWSQTQQLLSGDPNPNDTFGRAVQLDGTEALIFSAENGGGFPFPSGGGRVHVWRLISGTWTEGASIRPNDPSSGKGFGSALARHGDWLVVGASGDSEAGSIAGAAYVFERISGVWTQRQKLLPVDPASGSQFGSAVAIDDTWIVVGAPMADGDTADSGAAYAYRLTDGAWQFAGKLVASDGIAGDAFGRSVAVRANRILVGAPDATVDGFTLAGRGYVFTVPEYFEATQARSAVDNALRAIFQPAKRQIRGWPR